MKLTFPPGDHSSGHDFGKERLYDGAVINPGFSCKLGEEKQPLHSYIIQKLPFFKPLSSFSGHKEGNYAAGLGYLSKRDQGKR